MPVAVRIVCLSSNKACGCVGRVAEELQRFFIVWLEERQGEIAVSDFDTVKRRIVKIM